MFCVRVEKFAFYFSLIPLSPLYDAALCASIFVGSLSSDLIVARKTVTVRTLVHLPQIWFSVFSFEIISWLLGAFGELCVVRELTQTLVNLIY